jgi:hypothetical protein
MTTMLVDDLGRIPMSPYLTATLTRAADYATAQSHREVALEHLLLALCEDPEATIVLKTSHIDLARLTAEVSDFLGRSEDRIDPAAGQTIAISADLRRILEAAAAAARQGRRRELNGAIVLAAIVGDGKSTAANLLRVQGLTFEEAIRALQRATAAPPAPEPMPPAPAPHHQPQPHPPPQPAPERPLPQTDFSRPASTEEILASARERLQARAPADGQMPAPAPAPAHAPAPMMPEPPLPPPAPLPRANYPDLGGPPRPAPPPTPPEPAFEREYPPSSGHPIHRQADPGDDLSSFGAERPGALDEPPTRWARPPQPMPPPEAPGQHAPYPAPPPSPYSPPAGPRLDAPPSATRAAPPPQQADRRRAGSGPFVGSWPLIEAGQLVENIPRRMRVDVPVVVEARIARADVKALAEGLQGGGGAFRHEIVVTKAMSVRLRAPDGGFAIENRSPETQWIENVLGMGNDDYASWRWTVTPRTRGRRQLQLIVSARTVGADGMTAETALPDQMVDVRVAINYTRTVGRWMGWIVAAVLGGLLAKFGETFYVILKLMAAKHLGL